MADNAAYEAVSAGRRNDAHSSPAAEAWLAGTPAVMVFGARWPVVVLVDIRGAEGAGFAAAPALRCGITPRAGMASRPAAWGVSFKTRMSADGAWPSPTFDCRGVVTLLSGLTGRNLLDLGRLGTESGLATAEQFLDLGFLADLLADVIELGAADLAVAKDFYLLDAR